MAPAASPSSSTWPPQSTRRWLVSCFRVQCSSSACSVNVSYTKRPTASRASTPSAGVNMAARPSRVFAASGMGAPPVGKRKLPQMPM